MNRKKLMSKIITAVVAGGVLLSTGSLAFAKSNTNTANGLTTKSQHIKMNKANSTENIKTELDALVTAGTITADQETTILNSMKQEQTGKQAQMEKVKNMTEAERKTYFESKSKEKTDSLSNLVTDGTLTKTQADAVANIIHQGHDGKERGGNPKQLKTQLNTLVTAGTITQDEETNILKYLTEKQTARQAEMDKVKNMTEAERKTYFENNKKEKTDLFSELVTAGIISQDKADAIKTAMPTPKDRDTNQDVKTN